MADSLLSGDVVSDTGILPEIRTGSAWDPLLTGGFGVDPTGGSVFGNASQGVALDASDAGLPLLAQRLTGSSSAGQETGIRAVRLVGSGREGVVEGLVTRTSVAPGVEEIIVTPAREQDGSVSALIPAGAGFDADQPSQTYRVPEGTPLIRVTGSVVGVPGSSTAVGDPQVEPGAQPPRASGIPPNLVRAPIYAGSGAVADFFLNRAINPNLTVSEFAPLGTRGFLQNLVIAGVLPGFTAFDPLTNAVLNGARDAVISQGLSVGARRVVNPALNGITDRRNPGNAPANIRSDFTVGLNQIDIPLLDPSRLTVSPNVSLNAGMPLRVDVGRLPSRAVTPDGFNLGSDLFPERFLVGPTGAVGFRTGLDQEFVPTPLAVTQPLPEGWRTGVLPSRQASPQQRQLETTGDLLGVGDQFPDRLAPLTAFDLTDAPPAVVQRAQRVTDATVLGINFGVPLANWAADEMLRATGQEGNVPLGTLARGVATGAGVGLPISIAERRLVPGAFIHPTWQSIVADTAARAVLSAAPEPVQQAFAEACSDENPAMNAAAWLACNLGQNPNQIPPTPPFAGGGGGVVVDAAPSWGNGAFSLADSSVGTLTAMEPAPTVDRSTLLRDMQEGQRQLLTRGVQADTAAQVFNKMPEIAQRYGLTPREATMALGGTPSDEVGRRIVGPRIVGPAIVGPGIVGPGIVGPCLRGMECWGNGEAGILYVGPGETASPPSPVAAPPAPVTSRPVVQAPTPETRDEQLPPPPERAGGNWFWNAATGAWNWLQEANAEAARILTDSPQEVVNVQRNQYFWPTAYEVRFRDGRQGVYDAGSGNLLSGSGPANVQPGILQITPQSGLRVGPFMMPAGSGGGLPVGFPVVP
jgi:hypothetical protein